MNNPLFRRPRHPRKCRFLALEHACPAGWKRYIFRLGCHINIPLEDIFRHKTMKMEGASRKPLESDTKMSGSESEKSWRDPLSIMSRSCVGHVRSSAEPPWAFFRIWQ